MSIEQHAPDAQQARLAALYEISARLGTTLNLPELLNTVMDSIIQLTGAERGYVMLYDDTAGALKMAAARNVEQETLHRPSLDISRTVVDQAVQTGQAILTNNAQKDERFAAQQSVVGFQLRSIMCAPLQARGRVTGAVYVDNRLFAGVFEQEDLELLTAFSNQAAMAIENARLFEQTDQALARRVQELNLFQQIDRELNKSLDLDHVLSLALDWAISLTAADSGSIGLFDTNEAGGRELRLLVYQGDELHRETIVVPAGHPILAKVLRTATSVLTPNVTADQALDGTPAAIQLAVPVMVENQVSGLISLESRTPLAFSGEDITFVEQLADRAAVAIENARLYRRVRTANEAKSQFVSLVTHELRVPLTSLKGYADLLASGVAGPINPQQGQFVAVMQRNAGRMTSLISDLADINHIETGKMRFEMAAFSLATIIAEAGDNLREAFAAKKQSLTFDLQPEEINVFADRTRTGQVMTNLLSNAHKYTPEGGHVTVRLRQQGDFAHVAVIDTGIGIKPADQKRLFSQFFRAEDQQVRDENGWGLGLSIVKMMVEAQKGTIGFESEYGHGSTFWFTVPTAGEPNGAAAI